MSSRPTSLPHSQIQGRLRLAVYPEPAQPGGFPSQRTIIRGIFTGAQAKLVNRGEDSCSLTTFL